MECSFEEKIDHPTSGFTHSKCVNKAEIWDINDPCYGLCYSCAYRKLQAENNHLQAELQQAKEEIGRLKEMITEVADDLRYLTQEGRGDIPDWICKRTSHCVNKIDQALKDAAEQAKRE